MLAKKETQFCLLETGGGGGQGCRYDMGLHNLPSDYIWDYKKNRGITRGITKKKPFGLHTGLQKRPSDYNGITKKIVGLQRDSKKNRRITAGLYANIFGLHRDYIKITSGLQFST